MICTGKLSFPSRPFPSKQSPLNLASGSGGALWAPPADPSIWCILAFKYDDFNYFPLNQLTKFSLNSKGKSELKWLLNGQFDHWGRRSFARLSSPAIVLCRSLRGVWLWVHFVSVACLCGSLAQCVLSLKRLSAGPGFNPQTRQNKLLQDYWRACFEINFSDRQEGLTVSSIICER